MDSFVFWKVLEVRTIFSKLKSDNNLTVVVVSWEILFKKEFSLPSWSGFWFDFEAAHCTNQPSNKYDKIRSFYPQKEEKFHFSRRFHIYFQQISVWETWKLRHMSSFYSRCQIAQVFLHLAECNPKIFLLYFTIILKYFTYIWLKFRFSIFASRIPKTSSNVGHRRGEKIYHLEEWDPFNGLKLEESLKLSVDRLFHRPLHRSVRIQTCGGQSPVRRWEFSLRMIWRKKF